MRIFVGAICLGDCSVDFLPRCVIFVYSSYERYSVAGHVGDGTCAVIPCKKCMIKTA